MRITCLQENLSRGLGIVGRAVATRTTLPITNHVLISTDDSRLKLSATNLEVAISCWVGAQVEEEGAIAIPAGLLTDFVVSLPSDTIKMSVPSGTQSMEIQCAKSEAHISGQKADEFPPIPQIGEGITTKVSAGALRTAIGQVIFAAATDDSRPVLTGAYARFSGDGLTMVAADGFRLAVYNLSLDEPVGEEAGVIIPARSLRETTSPSEKPTQWARWPWRPAAASWSPGRRGGRPEHRQQLNWRIPSTPGACGSRRMIRLGTTT